MPIVLLDSTPLGLLTHPTQDKEPLECKKWAKDLVLGGIQIAIPQIIDYELRRELIRIRKDRSIQQLNTIKQTFPVAYVTEEVTTKAAQLWAWAHNTGQQTAHKKSIDIDVILAAQAIVLAKEQEDYVVIATGNVKHLARYTPAMLWENITIQNCLNPKKNQIPIHVVGS
jgi:hypothetical protein